MSVKYQQKDNMPKPVKNTAKAAAYEKSIAKTVLSNVGFYLMLAMDIVCLVLMLCGGYIVGLMGLFCLALAFEVVCVLLLLPKPILQIGIASKNVLQKVAYALPPVLLFIMGVSISSGGDTNAALAVYGFLAAARAIAYVATFVLSRFGAVCGGVAVLVPLLLICFVGGVGVSAEYPLGNRPLSFTYVEADTYHGEGFMVTQVYGGVRNNVHIPATYHGLPVVGIRCPDIKATSLDLPESVTYVDFSTATVRDIVVRAPGAYVAVSQARARQPIRFSFTSEEELPRYVDRFTITPQIYVPKTLVDEALKSETFQYLRDNVYPLVNANENFVVFHTDCSLSESDEIPDFFENTRIVSSGAGVSLPEPDLTGRAEDDYAFLGWYTSRDYTERVKSVPAGENAVLFAKYLKLYTVSFYDDEGEKYDDITLRFHAESGEVALPTDVEKEGYAFCGWFGFSDYYIRKGADTRTISGSKTGDRSFKAVFKKIYTVNWHLDGADEAPADLPATYHAWSDDFELANTAVVKEGYTFMGWYTDDDFTHECSKLPGTYSGNLNVYAKFNKNYSLTLDFNDGAAVPAVKYCYHKDSGIVLPTPTRTGYGFLGWQDEQEGRIVSHVLSGSTGDKVFVAQWAPITYTIRYKSSSISTSYVDGPTFIYDGTENKLTAEWEYTRTGYIFTGWEIDGDVYEKTEGESEIPVSKNYATQQGVVVDAVAVWAPITYTVHYESGCDDDPQLRGSTPDSTFTYNAFKTLRECGYTRVGYEFIGWHYQNRLYEGGATVVTDFAETQGAEVVLTARWQAISYSVAYTMEKDDSSTSFTCQYRYDLSFVLPDSTMHHKGYECTGWKVKGTVYPIDGESRAYNFVTSADEKTVTAEAVWTPITYTVAFYSNAHGSGQPFTTMTFTYDQESTLPSCDAQQDGYAFFGWNVATRQSGVSHSVNERHAAGKTAAFNFTDIKGITVTATVAFEPITYTVEFYESAEKGAPLLYTATFTYGAYNDVPACTATREGYRFVEWEVPRGNGQIDILKGGAQSPNALTKTAGAVVKAYGRWEKIE